MIYWTIGIDISKCISDMMGELSSKLCRAEGKRVVQLNLSTFGGRDVDVTQSRVANLLLAAAVKGMLGSEHEPSVNYVNATFQARALGINTQVRDFRGFMYWHIYIHLYLYSFVYT